MMHVVTCRTMATPGTRDRQRQSLNMSLQLLKQGIVSFHRGEKYGTSRVIITIKK